MKTIAPMDTGVHKQGSGYERTILFADRTDQHGLVLFKVEIRVDRIPEQSFARVSQWTSGEDATWVPIDEMGAIQFWYDVPGWERFASDRTERSTYRLALELLEVAREIHRALV